MVDTLKHSTPASGVIPQVLLEDISGTLEYGVSGCRACDFSGFASQNRLEWRPQQQ